MCSSDLKSGVHTKFIPDYNNIIPTKPYTEDILGLPVINIRYVPLSNTFNALIKRTMDIIGSSIAIIVSSPVMLILCILIKLTSPGPLIYKQERVGLHNQTFRVYKFRSMEIQKESEEKKAWTVKNDPRVTGIGKFMRHTSLDEEYWAEHQQDFFYIVDGSFLEEYDEYNIGVQFKAAATVSITYALMSRCGLEPERYFDHEDFMAIFDFNTPSTIGALGTAVSQINQQVLRQIGVTVRNAEREASCWLASAPSTSISGIAAASSFTAFCTRGLSR